MQIHQPKPNPSLEKVARGISLYENGNKTDFMCFKQKGAIFTLYIKTLKLEDQFKLFSNNISFTESDVNIR